LLESAALKQGGKLTPKAKHDSGRPIAHKYREGKMKSTLKRESKALEIVEIDTFGVSGCFVFGLPWLSNWGGAMPVPQPRTEAGDSGLTPVTSKAT